MCPTQIKEEISDHIFKDISDETHVQKEFTSLTAVGKWATDRAYAHKRPSIPESNSIPFSAAAAAASSLMRFTTWSSIITIEVSNGGDYREMKMELSFVQWDFAFGVGPLLSFDWLFCIQYESSLFSTCGAWSEVVVWIRMQSNLLRFIEGRTTHFSISWHAKN